MYWFYLKNIEIRSYLLKQNLPVWYQRAWNFLVIFLTSAKFLWWFHQFGQNCEKNWFYVFFILHVTFNYHNLWNGCKLFILWLSPLSQQKRDSIFGFNFHSLSYKRRTDIFHCLLTFTLFTLFLTLLMELFSNRAFVELEDNIRNKLNST